MPSHSRSGRPSADGAGSQSGWQRWRDTRKRKHAAKKRRLARMSRKKRVLRRTGIVATSLLAVLALCVSVLAFAVYKLADVPSPDSLDTSQTAILYYADGTEMARVGAENRIVVPLSKVPEHVRDAVIAAEDRNFYSEPGVSVKGTLRAVWNDITGGDQQGGSTITQQYVKNAYLNADQTLSRKVKEAAIALKLSREYSKDDILENYLNTIYFGRGAYGIEAASEAYFGVSVDKLDVSQGALLAAVIKSPEYFDPAVNAAAAKGRWDYVVDGMVSTGALTQAQRAALKFPATITQKTQSSATAGPMGLVWKQVQAELGEHGIDAAEINTKGLRIYTTIDPKAQQDATQAIADHWADLTPEQKNLVPALVAVSPANGAVLAYYGNSNGANLDYANSYFPPGSSFKPYTLATALTQNLQGKKPAYALDSVYNGNYCVTIAGTRICNDPGDEGVSGMKTLAYAMQVSLNTTYDGLAYEIGPSNVAATAHAMGIAKTRPGTDQPTLVNAAGQTTFGIGIGDSDYSVRPIDQAVGFATIANGGTTHQAHFITKVTDAKGNVLYQYANQGTRSLDPRVANDVGLALKPVADWSGVPLADGRESGSKTGTAGIQDSTDGANSDAWMVGYTPQVSAAVWVGTGAVSPIVNSSGEPEYGADLPGHIWQQFMDTYLAGQPNLPLPTKQEIHGGSNVAPTTTAPKTTAPTTTAPTTTAPKTTSAAPTTSAPETSAEPSETATATESATGTATATATCPVPVGGACPTAPGGGGGAGGGGGGGGPGGAGGAGGLVGAGAAGGG